MNTFDPEKGRQLLAEAQAWTAKNGEARPVKSSASVFPSLRAEFEKLMADCPRQVEIPFDKTPEGERLSQFRRVIDSRFDVPIDRDLITARASFDRVVNWDGKFPGVCATGATGTGKTFAAWQALRRLYVEQNRTFKWFPVRLLVTELERYDKNECAADFFRMCDMHRILFIDDIDKINWDFESHAQMLFSFMDWIYRAKKPCIITTNRSRQWWEQKAGAALVRRLFVDGCTEVIF